MKLTTYVGFDRAVMIGREGLHREVLLDMFRRAGATDVVNYISTGNVSFALPEDQIDELIASVGRDLDELLGRPTPVFVRSLEELLAMLDQDPWRRAPHDDVIDRTVIFFRDRVPNDLPVPLESTVR